MLNPVVVNDIEYLTQKAFADRLSVNVKTINRYIAKGKLRLSNVDGKYLLAFEENKKAFEKEQSKILRSINRKYRPTAQIDPIVIPTIQDNGSPELQGIEYEEAPITAEEITIDELKSYNLNFNDFTESLEYTDTMEPLIDPVSKKLLFDYERLKSRLTAERYKLDIEELLEPYIDEEGHLFSLELSQRIFLDNAQAMANRVTDRIMQWALKNFHIEPKEKIKNEITKKVNKELNQYKMQIQDILEKHGEMNRK